ncbi:MAG: DNA translocase FtsK, partial [Desulfatibacillaceae bacterium]|nr:DNA translocase FtsK [Desulfatibacillaceae bacterium]
TKVLIAEKPKTPPKIKKSAPKPIAPPARQETLLFPNEEKGYTLPPVSLLEDPPPRPEGADQKNLQMQARLLEKKLEDFGVHGKVVEVSPGPVITTFEYEPAPGVKINRITNLAQDLTMALRAMSVRIVGPIPGKAAVGIEVPNAERELVCFKEIVSCPDFSSQRSKLTLCLGKDIVGGPVVADLSKMPHLLIAGATGSGKSVALNTMIASILFKYSPEQVKFVMIDPKRIELSTYDGIPHLICPVVCDAKKATNALFWAVREMETRYEAMAKVGARNISGYNQKIADKAKNQPPKAPEEAEQSAQISPDDSAQDNSAQSNAPALPVKEEPPPEPMPFVVIIIDELADLMMVASRDVEVALARLAQMARAAGLHLILATQRPSVDVLTGTIKANFPARVAFQVSSRTDSRTILDSNGAEDLLGRGDMLFMPPGAAKLQRIHGAYISDEELAQVLAFIRQQSRPQYDTSITDAPASNGENGATQDEQEYDEKYDEAVAIVTQTRQASISMIQRRLRIGYNRAARIIEIMEREGVVGPSDGVKPREVLVPGYEE